MSASDNRAFADIAARAQRLANERGGDYSALTYDELCRFMVEFDEALPPYGSGAAADGAASDRDLAEAIYAEIISPKGVEWALDLWQQYPDLDDRSRMWRVLARTSANAIDTVLARRLREAARSGSWDGGHHFQEEDGYPGSLLPPKRGET